MRAEVEIRLDCEKQQIQAWLDEKLIGRVTVEPVSFDWGRGTVLPMGGISGVGTDEEYRRRGIARRMIAKAVEFSREQGYPVGGVSTGCGNTARRLYAGSGYVHLFSVDQYEKPVGRPEPARPPDGVLIRPYVPGDSRHQTRTVEGLVEFGCQRRDGCVFQVAILDLPDLLDRLQPLYVERLRSSHLDSWPSALRVEMGEQAAEIELPAGNAGGRIEISGPYETLVRVLCGRCSAWQEYLRGHLRIAGNPGGDHGPVLNAILGRYPWFHPQRDRW